jgi:hypothetical protein
MIDHGVFDSEALDLMRTALDHAWEALPPDQQTAETRERLAQAVVALAMQWERDPADLSLNESMKASLGLGDPSASIVIPQHNCGS